jgi:predicted GNAT superfamily acetyltransferase
MIQPLTSESQRRICFSIQREVWGMADEDLFGPEALKAVTEDGGILLGAFRGKQMVGFVMSLALQTAGLKIQHSHMLATLPGYRDSGIGYSLKLAQYEAALRLSADYIIWTFDPLLAKNAHLNLNKLGATAHRYYINLYGKTASPLHQGLETDRLLAEWEVREEASRGPDRDRQVTALAALDSESLPSGLPSPLQPILGLQSPLLKVAIPTDISAVMEHSPRLAERWREFSRKAFNHYLASGYVVDRLVDDGNERTKSYVLRRDAGAASQIDLDGETLLCYRDRYGQG